MGRNRDRITTADRIATLIVLLLVPALLVPMIVTVAAGPALRLADGPVVAGQRTKIVGEGFDARSAGTLELNDVQVARYNVSRRGTFEISIPVPKNLPPGSHTLTARSGGVSLASLVLLSATVSLQGTPAGASDADRARGTRAPSEISGLEVGAATPVDLPTQTPSATPTPLPTPELFPTPTPLPTPAPVIMPPPVFVWAPVATPPPILAPAGPAAPPLLQPPIGVSRTFGPTVTAAELVAAISDNSLDTILLSPGTYRVGGLHISANRTRPVTVRPESTGVTFDGDSVPGTQSTFAWFSGAANITFAGFTVTDYGPIGTGVIVLTDGAHHITFDGLTMTGNRMTSSNDHLIYPAGYCCAVHDLTIQNSTLNGASGGAVHLYHAPGAYNVVVRNNQISNNLWGIIAAVSGGRVTATGNAFSGNGVNMIAYAGSIITASGNSPSDYVDPN